MHFEVEHLQKVSIITVLKPKIDSQIATELKSEIIATAGLNPKSALIIDLEKVKLADSSGLSALILAHRIYRDSNRDLVICSLSERIQRLIEISHLDSAFRIQENRESALKSLSLD